ncbi:MAG: DUF1223 domain-containing protein [Pseudolabrys sp.]
MTGVKIRSILVAAAVATGAFGAGATSALAAGPRAVIELFTSQGCSSCPPADRLLGQLAQDPSLIALSVPVDYWDYLGWKDTLALPVDSVRQRDYAVARGDREVYTPQVVINGMVHALGSNKDAIEDAIVKTRRESDPLSLPVSVKVDDGTITVAVPAATGEHTSGEVWLCPVTAKARVSIGRGENRGRTVVYHNVVRRWVKLGAWHGKAETFRVKLATLPDARFSIADIDRAAVLLQSGSAQRPGMILGAAMTSVPAAAVR